MPPKTQAPPPNRLPLLLATTLELSHQFQTTLSTTTYPPTSTPNTAEQQQQQQQQPQTQDSLSLLSNSSTALKSQTTKLSLLTITPPFTQSAICTVLSALTDSVLPSLITAALLVTPDAYTSAFCHELRILSKAALKELSALVEIVRVIAGKKEDAASRGEKEKEGEVLKEEKDAVTTATGRVWEACDVLVDFSGRGVVGFVVRRVEQWRDLVRDAVDEIVEWDPEEDDGGDGFFDLGDDGGDGIGESGGDGDGEDDDENENEDQSQKKKADVAFLQEQKNSILRILKQIAQIYPAILSNRLKKATESFVTSPAGMKRLEGLIPSLQDIPNLIDEVAGALYEGNIEVSFRHLAMARVCATKAVLMTVAPFDAGGGDGRDDSEDKFAAWSKIWFNVINEVAEPLHNSANQKESGK